MNLKTIALAAALIGASFSASAHDYKLGDLVINHPWARATPGGATTGGGYLSVENKGAAVDKIIGGTVEVANAVEVHEMSNKDGVMTMRLLSSGLAIAPGKTVKFGPGGYHLMFVGLKRPLVAGEKLKGTLTFEKAGSVDVEFNVEPIGFTPKPEAGAAPASEHKH